MKHAARNGLFALVALAIVASVTPGVGAQGHAPIALRIATSTPRGSPWNRALESWGELLQTRTGGQLTLALEPGLPSDESAIVQRLRAHGIDGASLSASGLAQIAPGVLVLQAPGVCPEYSALEQVRTSLDVTLRQEFASNGTELLGWSEYGTARLFSSRRIERPRDLRRSTAWVTPGDPILAELIGTVGATVVPASFADVLGRLNGRSIDTVLAPALIVAPLGWRSFRYINLRSSGVLIGATVLDARRMATLPSPLRAVLLSTAEQAHAALRREVRLEDERFIARMRERPIQVIHSESFDAEWRSAEEHARSRLVGRIFTQQALDRAIAATER